MAHCVSLAMAPIIPSMWILGTDYSVSCGDRPRCRSRGRLVHSPCNSVYTLYIAARRGRLSFIVEGKEMGSSSWSTSLPSILGMK